MNEEPGIDNPMLDYILDDEEEYRNEITRALGLDRPDYALLFDTIGCINRIIELARDREGTNLQTIIDLLHQIERNSTEAELRRVILRSEAFNDPLTGLHSIQAISDLTKDLSQRLNQRASFLVVFLDMDGLKVINDSLGHIKGDLLLQSYGSRLKEVLRNKGRDTIAIRHGGDEFSILVYPTQSVMPFWEVRLLNRLQEDLDKVASDFRNNLTTDEVARMEKYCRHNNKVFADFRMSIGAASLCCNKIKSFRAYGSHFVTIRIEAGLKDTSYWSSSDSVSLYSYLMRCADLEMLSVKKWRKRAKRLYSAYLGTCSPNS